jgi:hypothetical protein
VDTDANLLTMTKVGCQGSAIVRRCPSQGMTGSCDLGKKGAYYNYGQQAVMGRWLCESAGGSWSAS